MKMAKISALLFFLIVFPAFAIVKTPEVVYPGDIFFIEVGDEPGESVIGISFNGVSLGLFQFKRGFGSFAGIDVASLSGKKEVIVRYRDRNRNEIYKKYFLNIDPKKFSEISVSRKPLTKKELARYKKDKAMIKKALLKSSPHPYWKDDFVTPVASPVVSAGGEFGVIRKSKLGKTYHGGADYWGHVGDPVSAANDGKVVLTGSMLLEGKIVIIDHGIGFRTLYTHLDAITVRTGDMVYRGQNIGTLGNTGRSTGPHLHFGALLNGARIDPSQIFQSFAMGTARDDSFKNIDPKEHSSASTEAGSAGILDKINEAKKALAEETVSFITKDERRPVYVKRKKTYVVKKIIVGKEIVLATLAPDDKIRIVRLDVPLSKKQTKNNYIVLNVEPNECQVKKIGGGGVNTDFEVICNGNKEKKIVLAGKYLVFDEKKIIFTDKTLKESEQVIYSPYS